MPTIGLALERNAQRVPEREALVFGERRLTYAELDREVNRTARGLARLGLQKGGRVALFSPNTDMFLIAYLAVMKLGCIFVPINPRSAPPELAYQLADSEAAALVFDPVLAPVVEAARQAGVTMEHFLATRPLAGWQDLATLAAAESADPPPVTVSEWDDAQILYTSGTTGKPKGVLLDQHRIIWTGLNLALGVGIKDGDRMLHVAPLYHSAELNLFVSSGVLLGCTHVIAPAFDPTAVLDVMAREQISIFFGVPTMYQFLLRHPEFGKRDLSAWRVGMYGAAPMAPSVVRELVAALPAVQIYNLCGLTEMGPGGIYLLPDEQLSKTGAGGRAIVNTLARVVDGDMLDVPPGTVGELILQGETMMKGYWRKPEATAEVIRDGWLLTGDLATIDAEGYITLVDRKKDMLITGGMNVYSVEVENAVQAHPNVQDCAVVGVPHPEYGETVVAVVKLKPGTELSLEELREHCGRLIADYKVPRRLVISEVPRNASGKILKYQLREQIAKQA